MSQDDRASDAAARGPAASEERIIAGAAEFTSTASTATRFLTTVFQALLVAAVALWVLDIPRQVFNVSFYTEQLLAVCLGLTLALAYVSETPKKPSAIDWSGAVAAITILRLYRTPSPVTERHSAVPDCRTGREPDLDIPRQPRVRRALVRLARRHRLARHLRLYRAALRGADLRNRLLPLEGIIGSAILIFLVLDASRRTSGWGFVGIILAMAVYIYISPYFPGDFQTRAVSPERLVVYLGLDINGIIGSILQVAVLVVIPFTILGQVLARTGGADFFADLSMSAMGHFRGGAAKIAVVGSALFGMISGSAVSNVLAVGIVTIPTMIRSGFTPYRAAAIESVGSTGGQLMPPVMGASAFIMAEFLQVSYGAVCIAAAIPAILYYACLFIHVDLESRPSTRSAPRRSRARRRSARCSARAGTSWCRSRSSSFR